ncbi:uncharacterized protein LOC108108650 [Drosophila eugracilis]|uniref:uncharacterized protein LOC108108650 n=1 Tax=Drosophila eugracilis TaxID=29029 RepID=UPI0007E6C3F3|nr:uncharacterized protein LOC108108650 [Drosophila eugracilis]
MRPKEHPDLHFDVIPKLYEAHCKVFITSLCHVQNQLKMLPRRFCRMYTTRPLANQLLLYLKSRKANINEQDFKMVEEGQPFPLVLSDGKRLEAMLCSGSYLDNSLILLIRRQRGGRLLYCYSFMRLDNLGQLLGNATFNSWIAEGTENLYLNLSSVNKPFAHVDFDEMANTIEEYGKENRSVVYLNLPKFGYEEMLWRLAHTHLRGHIRLDKKFAESYKCLSSDMERFEEEDCVLKVYVCGSLKGLELIYQPTQVVPMEIENLKWSPAPTRMHLRQLCSLLRPQHIQGIVKFHSDGIVPPVPTFLKIFKANYSPQNKEIVSRVQGEPPSKVAKVAPFRAFQARKQFQFVDDDDSNSD